MSGYTFTVLDVSAEPYAVAPQLTARLRIASTGPRVHAIALRSQVRIEPQRRRYTGTEEHALRGLFGERERWGETLKSFLWMQANTTVQGFAGQTETDLALPCTYDLEVIGTRFLHALQAGDVPLNLLFSGTIFTRGASGFEVEQVPWACEARWSMPVSVWHDMIDSYFPNSGFVRISADLLKELASFRARHDLISWDETLRNLLAAADEAAP
jgi:hypothetical protein